MIVMYLVYNEPEEEYLAIDLPKDDARRLVDEWEQDKTDVSLLGFLTFEDFKSMNPNLVHKIRDRHVRTVDGGDE